MHHDTIAITHSHDIQIHDNDNDTWLCADVNVDWIYGMVSSWLWANSAYVGFSVRLNLDGSLLGIRFTMTSSQLHTRVIFKYTAITMTNDSSKWLCAGVNVDWIWNGIMFALDEQIVRWY